MQLDTGTSRQCRSLLRPRSIALAGLTGLLLALAGCGGGNDDNRNANNGNGSGNGAGNGTQTDSFITQVNNVIGTSSETGDPVATDTITATTPEQSEPVPLG